MSSIFYLFCKFSILIILTSVGLGLSIFFTYDFCNDDIYNLSRFIPYVPNNTFFCAQSIFAIICFVLLLFGIGILLCITIIKRRIESQYESI